MIFFETLCLMHLNKMKHCFYLQPNFRYKKTATKRFFSLNHQVGALREIRTPDPLVRSQVLYPAEL